MKFIKIFKMLIFLLLFFIFLIIDLYIRLKEGKNLEIVTVEVKISNLDLFNQINVYRISPNNFVSSFLKDEIYFSFYSKPYEYLKNVKLVIPIDVLDEIEKITVRINQKEFTYSKDELLTKWIVNKNQNILEFVSPPHLKFKTSFIPKIKDVINWSGDRKFFISSLIFYILCFLILILLYFLFRIYIKRKSDKDRIACVMDFDEKIYYLFNNDKDFKYRYQLVYIVLFFLIIFIALLQRFVLCIIPYGGNDTWSYIGTAVKTIDSNSFIRTGDRNFFYPFFILIVLSLFKNFSYITLIQHLSGILAGVILLIVFKRIMNYFGVYRRNIFIIDILSLLLLALFLFSESMIVYEHTIRPEGLYQFFLVLQIFFLIELIIAIRENVKIWIYLLLTLFFLNNYALFLLQPRWGFTLFFNVFLFLIFIFLFKDNLLKKIIFGFIMPIFLAFLFLYMPQNLITRNNDAIDVFLSAKLFFTHIKIIDKELKKDLENPNFRKYDKEILRRLLEYHQEEYKKPQRKHKYLGFMHNNLIYGGNCASNYLLNKLGKEGYNKFTRYYFIKAVLNNPFDYIKKVLLELSQFYNFYGGMYPSKKFKFDPEAYEEEKITDLSVKNFIYRSYQNIRYHLEKTYYDFQELEIYPVKIFYFILSKVYLVTFVLFFIMFFSRLFFDYRNRLFKKEIIYGIVILILFLYNFFINLTNAMTYCLDVDRYIDDQFIILLTSHILAIIYIVINIKDFYAIKKH